MSAKERYIVGVDLGGTNIVAGAMPVDGRREIAMHTTPTLADTGAEAVADRIAGMIEQVIAETMTETGATRGDFIGVGIGAPGPLNREKGIVIVTPNLGWKNFPLRDEISRRVSLEATLDNDANCATLGEFWCGAAVGGWNVIGITLGTGVANLLNIFNPDIVVLAGGVTQAGDALFQPLRAEVRRRAFKPAVQACRILPGALPLSAGVVGAIATFKQQKLGEL